MYMINYLISAIIRVPINQPVLSNVTTVLKIAQLGRDEAFRQNSYRLPKGEGSNKSEELGTFVGFVRKA